MDSCKPHRQCKHSDTCRQQSQTGFPLTLLKDPVKDSRVSGQGLHREPLAPHIPDSHLDTQSEHRALIKPEVLAEGPCDLLQSLDGPLPTKCCLGLWLLLKSSALGGDFPLDPSPDLGLLRIRSQLGHNLSESLSLHVTGRNLRMVLHSHQDARRIYEWISTQGP